MKDYIQEGLVIAVFVIIIVVIAHLFQSKSAPTDEVATTTHTGVATLSGFASYDASIYSPSATTIFEDLTVSDVEQALDDCIEKTQTNGYITFKFGIGDHTRRNFHITCEEI